MLSLAMQLFRNTETKDHGKKLFTNSSITTIIFRHQKIQIIIGHLETSCKN